MSTFKPTQELYQQIDYRIAVNNWVRFYTSSGELGKDRDQLDQIGYTSVEFNCQGLSHVLEQFNTHFHFPDYFRNNLDALNDCLQDLEISGTGLVIVIKNLQNLKKEDSEGLLEILTERARINFITGKRLLILAHAVDVNFNLESVSITRTDL